ncbi:hypothetical protein J8K62_01260 [Streptococcus suis]|uniref:Sakacin A production response regulator n=4 Tax=Streptococcus suis TaxID=1307 RepID=A0A0H3MWX8_STRS4|nr:hypothetical protein [Streptococcus suis]ABP90759.1 hypothetical protein SSU05_1793 [Streptococcus suis 05ZYH33]ABP92957.1 hypothetical protein SSU98_1799 [Streptococcus suis 98HAH33]ADE32071.1 hypothetical protein SSGZ1_1615 [Streptococcus suis GZ1]ADV70812.1 hypothetical protein SSUJS14_1754 [Streptococcus suis JS14]AEB82045.1 hypothetical protein SSUST3_1630 [Streptococcus suis ST3]
MLEQCRRYLDYQGVHYCKPEKAGALAGDMIALKNVAQAARKEFQTLSLVLAEHVSPFVPERVSQWMNQAQICRPHFWTYYRFPSASLTDSALAIRLYGKGTEAGISVEVSFIERKKVETSLLQQNRVLNCSIAAPLYYWVQEGQVFYRLDGTEENRQSLLQAVEAGRIRKVLVKYDVPFRTVASEEELLERLIQGFSLLEPYLKMTHLAK